jgi:hypothetical protein
MVVHDGVALIRNVIIYLAYLGLTLVKVVIGVTVIDILPDNIHVIVSVWPGLGVNQSQPMEKFVY